MSRWISALLAFIVGIALGLVYGWVIDPVKFVDTTPNTLRSDYRTDYVLAVAEAYQAEQDPESAARRLAILGSEGPEQIAEAALQTARKYSFAESDILLMQKLTTAMQAWQPGPGSSLP